MDIASLVLGVIVLAVGILGFAATVDERDGAVWLSIVAIFGGGAICFYAMWQQGYKDGQSAALSGHVEYHLMLHEDSSVTWEKIKKER